MAISLNPNSIYSVFDNMIISQLTFANPIGGLKSDIVDANRVDGTLYGDTKSYKSVDMIGCDDWTNDAEAVNLLALKRNKKVKDEQIILDKFKMFKLTLDSFLTKQAFMTEGNFANFNSVQLSMIRDGKKAFDVTTYNTWLGTHGTQNKSITVSAGANEALVLSQGVADILDEMAELSRDFNANGYLRAFGKADVDIIFNSKYLNKWKYVDLPIVFHKDGILADHKVMNAKYFGRAVDEDTDIGSGKVIGTNGEIDATKGTIRSRVCKEFIFEGENLLVYPGDALGTGIKVGYEGGSVANPDFDESEVYVEVSDVVAIIVGKGAIPYMSAAEASTAFYNPQSLTTTNFLIFGYNTLKALGEKPYVVIKKA